MQIKQQLLAQQLQKTLAPLYVLIGQEPYLLNESLTAIKSALQKSCDYEEKFFSIQSAEDWSIMLQEANSYSLFSEAVFLNVFYDKKSIEAASKKLLMEYLEASNSRCYISIRAPNLPAKQLPWLCNHAQAVLVTSYPLTPEAMKSWISQLLKKNTFSFGPQIPSLIHQYTQGNMLACAQVIEKMALSNPLNSAITAEQVLEQVSDQCNNDLFELADACLLGQADKAIHIIRQAADNKTEATLVLWILTQEVRLLLQLVYKIGLTRQADFKTACTELKIWPQRQSLYPIAIKRLDNSALEVLFHYGKTIDESIKSNLSTQVWNALEKFALSLALGKSSLCNV